MDTMLQIHIIYNKNLGRLPQRVQVQGLSVSPLRDQLDQEQ